MAKLLRLVQGVHAHWTVAQWIRVEDVLRRAIDTAADLGRESQAAVAFDIDGRGLEELAARSPRALDDLRSAIASGWIEITGASFAQPSAVACGGESWLRQRVLGLAAFERLLNCRPRAIWEGQPPNTTQAVALLREFGVERLGLFPALEFCEVETPSHPGGWFRWPLGKDFAMPCLGSDPLSVALQRGEPHAAALAAAFAQRDEACLCVWWPLEPRRRSAMQARLQRLRSEGGFELRPTAFSRLTPRADDDFSPGSDQFFDGFAPAKNGDVLLRSVGWCEEQLIAAEGLSALLGRLPSGPASTLAGVGQQWPAWPFEQAWRDLCVAQHHATEFAGRRVISIADIAIESSLALSGEAQDQTLIELGQRVAGLEGGHLVLNPLGWPRDVLHDTGVARAVPAFGYKVVDPYDLDPAPLGRVRVRENEDRIALVRGRLRVEVDRRRGVIEQISTREFPGGLLDPSRPFLTPVMRRGDRIEEFAAAEVGITIEDDEETDELTLRRIGRGGVSVTFQIALEPLFDAVWVRVQSEELPTPDAGARSGLGLSLEPVLGPDARLVRDHAFGVEELPRSLPVRARRAPGGDGEIGIADSIDGHFRALRFVDISAADGSRGVLYVHDGSPCFERTPLGFLHRLTSVDPLDRESFEGVLTGDLWIVPHAGMTHAQRVRRAMECTLGNPRFQQTAEIRGGGYLPTAMGAVAVEPDHVLATSFRRESLGADGGECYSLRLVEFEGRATVATVRIVGEVTKALQVTPGGEILRELDVAPAKPPHGMPRGPGVQPWSRLEVPIDAQGVVTLQFR